MPGTTTTSTTNFDPLENYLRDHREQLLAYIASRLPKDLQRVVAPEDLFQDLCIRAHGSWASYRGQHDRVLQAWIYRIMDRAIIDVIRKPRVHVRGESGIIPPPEQRASSIMDVWSRMQGEHPTPEEVLSVQEINAEVQLAISKLSEQQARIVYMRLIEGLSQTEIAEQLGKTKTAVNSLLDAGKKRLGQILRDRSDRRRGSSDIGL